MPTLGRPEDRVGRLVVERLCAAFGVSSCEGRGGEKRTELEEVTLASVKAVERHRGAERDSESDVAVVGVVGGDENEAIALGLPRECGDGVCRRK